MKSIYKYRLPRYAGTVQELMMPVGAEVLSVQAQYGEPSLWATVPAGYPEATRERRTFHVVLTGESLPENVNLKFIGTCQFSGGSLVAHVFEELRVCY